MNSTLTKTITKGIDIDFSKKQILKGRSSVVLTNGKFTDNTFEGTIIHSSNSTIHIGDFSDQWEKNVFEVFNDKVTLFN